MLQERVDLATGKRIFESLITAIGHLHEKNLIHGDFKPSNAVRMGNGQWKLIDLDGSTEKGERLHDGKRSTAYWYAPHYFRLRTQEYF